MEGLTDSQIEKLGYGEAKADAVKNNGAARRPKTTPKKGRDERFDEQKRALQRMTMVALAHGRRHGLEADDVAALEEALRTLGWLPSDLKL